MMQRGRQLIKVITDTFHRNSWVVINAGSEKRRNGWWVEADTTYPSLEQLVHTLYCETLKKLYFVWKFHDAIILLFFLSLLYLLLVFGAPTAARAFELFTCFKRSQFGTDLRQCLCFSNSAVPFSITLFILSIFLLTWMERCWLVKTNHMTIQQTSGWKWNRVVRQWNKMIKLMICIGPDSRM